MSAGKPHLVVLQGLFKGREPPVGEDVVEDRLYPECRLNLSESAIHGLKFRFHFTTVAAMGGVEVDDLQLRCFCAPQSKNRQGRKE